MASRLRPLLVLCLLTALPAGAAHGQSGPAAATLALVDASVVDVADGTVDRDVDVLIRDRRIVTVGDVDVASAARIVDASDKYVIPGLWDMHVHLEWDGWDSSALLVAYGITGARDMWGDLEEIEERRGPSAGARLAPRVIMAGNLLDGPVSLMPGSTTVTTPEEARAAVDSLVEAGAPFVKVYDGLAPDVYDAIMDRARERGIDVAGHVPWRVRASRVADAGQRSIEHVFSVLPACSSAEDEALEHAAATLEHVGEQDRRAALDSFRRILRIMGRGDEGACRALADRLVANGTWLVPTLAVIRGSWLRDDPDFRDDPRLAEVPPSMRRSWLPESGFPARFLSPEDWEAAHAMYRRALEVVGLLHDAGVRILAGADAGNPYTFFGSGLHDELALLVEAGLSPAEALRTATLNPAEFLGETERFGTVEAGKVADLVILDANPLKDIAAVREIHGVVLDGTLIRGERLAEVIAATRAEFERSTSR